MGLFSPHITKLAEKIDPAMGLLQRTDPLAEGVTGYLTKKVRPNPLAPPTMDTAANASLDQQQAMLRRRGILGNVYGGGTGGAAPPATQSKSTLGT